MMAQDHLNCPKGHYSTYIRGSGKLFRPKYVLILKDAETGQWGTTIRDFGVLQFSRLSLQGQDFKKGGLRCRVFSLVGKKSDMLYIFWDQTSDLCNNSRCFGLVNSVTGRQLGGIVFLFRACLELHQGFL